jgi:hypothetical protein
VVNVEITVDIIDKNVSYKGRVWTIYSTCNDGVFSYQGLKPFASFNYHEDSKRFSTFKKNTTYIKRDEIILLSSDEIHAAVKKEAKEMKKPLSRKKAIDFYVYLTGHTKTFVSKNLFEAHHRFDFAPGASRYSLWKHKRGDRSFLILSNNMKGSESHVYYDFITFETDDIEIERSWEEVKQEIIDDFKEWTNIQ